MMKQTNDAIKQSVVSGVAAVGPGVRRVGFVRESFQSTSSGTMGRESSRGARPSTRWVGHGKNPIKSSKHSTKSKFRWRWKQVREILKKI